MEYLLEHTKISINTKVDNSSGIVGLCASDPYDRTGCSITYYPKPFGYKLENGSILTREDDIIKNVSITISDFPQLADNITLFLSENNIVVTKKEIVSEVVRLPNYKFNDVHRRIEEIKNNFEDIREKDYWVDETRPDVIKLRVEQNELLRNNKYFIVKTSNNIVLSFEIKVNNPIFKFLMKYDHVYKELQNAINKYGVNCIKN